MLKLNKITSFGSTELDDLEFKNKKEAKSWAENGFGYGSETKAYGSISFWVMSWIFIDV